MCVTLVSHRSSTHCESEKSERIEKNQSCLTIRISHKQLLAKNFAGVESGLYRTLSRKQWSLKYLHIAFLMREGDSNTEQSKELLKRLYNIPINTDKFTSVCCKLRARDINDTGIFALRAGAGYELANN